MGKLGIQFFHALKTNGEKGGGSKKKKKQQSYAPSTHSLSLYHERIFLSRGTTLLALQGVLLHTHARTRHAHRRLHTNCESRLALSVHEVSAASYSCTGVDKKEEPQRSEKEARPLGKRKKKK